MTKLFALFLFLFFKGFLVDLSAKVKYTDAGDSIEERIKSKSKLFFQLLLDNPKFGIGSKHIFNMSGNTLIGKGSETLSEEKNLEEIRSLKGAKSINLDDDKTFDQKNDAIDYIMEYLGEDSILILEKVAENKFRIRKFRLSFEDDLNL